MAQLRKLRHASGAISLCGIALLLCVLFATVSATALGASTPTVVLSLDRTTAQPGDAVTLTATVTNADGVTNSSGQPLGSVRFLNGTTQLNDNSQVVLTVLSPTELRATLTTSFGTGTYALVASYRTGIFGGTQSPPVTLTVGQVDLHLTTTTLTPSPAAVVPGQSLTLTATVDEVRGSNIPSGIVTFEDNGIPFANGEATLDANGQATITVDGFQAGRHVITASYAGDAVDRGSATTLDLTVPGSPLAVDTQTEVTVTPRFIHEGDTVTIVAHVHQKGFPTTPPAGNLVTFTANGVPLVPAEAPLDEHGNATIVVSGGWQSGADYDIEASYVGSDLFNPSTGDGTLSVVPDGLPLSQPTQIAYTGSTSADYGDPATLSATLVDGSGTGLEGKNVTLTLGSFSCTVATGPDGVASCPIAQVTLAPGSYTATASFAGDELYLAAPDATASFQVNRESTTATVTAPNAVAAGPVQLRGTVFEDGLPLAGASVTLSLGSLTCPAVTDTNGVAACGVVATVLGPASVGISYAGDVDYSGSSASLASGALVFAFAPGAGSFAIGDGNAAAGTTVTFWGAQWSKLNKVSGGPAPDAFKGYAAAGTRTCGGTWTTAPGNSSDPPAGALPSYMAVLVTSSVRKAGPAISGTVVHVVVVKTNGGYKNDPGHAGTGTVVAAVC